MLLFFFVLIILLFIVLIFFFIYISKFFNDKTFNCRIRSLIAERARARVALIAESVPIRYRQLLRSFDANDHYYYFLKHLFFLQVLVQEVRYVTDMFIRRLSVIVS